MCAATSTDLGVTYTDLNKTLWPSEIYDIRGVFDGTVILDGYEGNPSILYTATSPIGPLGATVDEIEGVETQAIAYTEDQGKTWTKLPYGAGGNPVIYEWPMDNLSESHETRVTRGGFAEPSPKSHGISLTSSPLAAGFRDPYIFPSPRLAALLAVNSTSNTTANSTDSNVFTTISGGVHDVGSKLFLYRQNQTGDVLNWNYVGPILETSVNETWNSEWSGSE